MHAHLGTHAADPIWHPAQQLTRARLPADLRDWLLDRSSLTRRLRQCCAGRFAVRLLGQSWQRPLPNEALALGANPVRRALVREVLLLCDDTPWVYARTVIPRTSLRGRLRRLSCLGEAPLGAVLFADPHMTRGPVEVASIRPDQLAAPLADGHTLWGRRSLFLLRRRPLLVTEVFLPALVEDRRGGPGRP